MGICADYIEVNGLPGGVLLTHEDASRYSYERPLATAERVRHRGYVRISAISAYSLLEIYMKLH